MTKLGSQSRLLDFTGVHKQHFTEIPLCPSADLGWFHLCCPHRLRRCYKRQLFVLRRKASICKLRFPAALHGEIKGCPFHRRLFDQHTASSGPVKQLLCSFPGPSSQFKAPKVSLWLYLHQKRPARHTHCSSYQNIPTLLHPTDPEPRPQQSRALKQDTKLMPFHFFKLSGYYRYSP